MDENTEKVTTAQEIPDESSETKQNEKSEIDPDSNNPKENEKTDEQTATEVKESSDNPPKHAFKKPVIIGPLRKSSSSKEKTSLPTVTSEEPKIQNEPVKDLTEEKKVSIPYKEPSWSGLPKSTYKFEVLKSGVILETIDLSKQNYFVVGRSPICDISMAHPSVSRFHAIIQYRAVGDEKNGEGMYVYDLESTHGTYWNGSRIRSKTYVRIQGGHMVKFGGSQRKFILLAPSVDQEEESEYTITELKEMRKLEIEAKEREKLEEIERMKEEKEKEENEGIDWGMGEDADEETDLTENPYAQTGNEELFLDDPKKTLRGWFEREGHELTYQTEDKGIGKFLCWVDLPLDEYIGRKMRAEALVSGKKKEAVIQCALEACRIIDRYGLLRQANHEAKRRKVRNWEEEDFYDSDEDNYLDRTGTVEKKREKRMKMAGKLETEAETYDSLLEKHSKLVEKIKNIEKVLELHKLKQEQMDDSNEDALDAFMSDLETSTLDKTEIKKKKFELVNLKKEETMLLKLINIAKPANLPALITHVESKSEKKLKDDKTVEIKKKFSLPKPKIKSPISIKNVEDESKSGSSSTNKEELTNIEISENESVCKDDKGTTSEEKSTTEVYSEPPKKISKKKNRGSKRNQLPAEETNISSSYDNQEFDEDYDMWVPPENQSGDGKTSLNEKLGY